MKVGCAVAVTLIPLIVLLSLLNSVVVPNYHGSRFKIGQCRIEALKLEVKLNRASWKDCSCGVTCTAQFPCVSISGDYTSYGEDTDKRNGSFHTDYSALVKNCFTVPDCKKDPTTNQKSVMDEVKMFYSNGSSRLNCWSLGDRILTENNYSAKRASLALFLPLLFFLLGLMILIKTSSKVRWICNKCCCDLIPKCSKKLCSRLEYCCAGCCSQEDFTISVNDQTQSTTPPRHRPAKPSAPLTHALNTPHSFEKEDIPPPYTEQYRTGWH